MSNTTTARRTQAERRAETSAKLIEATIQIVSEQGYAQATVKPICDRAGVTHGALFGRFATRLDLIVAAAAEVSRRQLERFLDNIARLPDIDDPAVIMPLLRQSARAPINAVWNELLVAARTDDQLRERLAPVTAEYGREILAVAEKVPAMQKIPQELRSGVLWVLIAQCDGDALTRLPFPSEDMDRRTMDVFVTMLQLYVESLDRLPS
ncbi:TetR/AcrR family transcriptional regulator [Nocardia sp. NPDC049149]|uniref:TetR/AcrR family transcriptional regulator n=1 Tax=Nocardia sp. NPDC049149 TaxID=3364315 RepID=UPI0037212062